MAHKQSSGGWQVHPDQTKVVRAKTVKSGHGRCYKRRALAVHKRQEQKKKGKNHRNNYQGEESQK